MVGHMKALRNKSTELLTVEVSGRHDMADADAADDHDEHDAAALLQRKYRANVAYRQTKQLRELREMTRQVKQEAAALLIECAFRCRAARDARAEGVPPRLRRPRGRAGSCSRISATSSSTSLRDRLRKSGRFATKSVSQLTSTITPSFAPFISRAVFVATVMPCAMSAIASGGAPVRPIAFITPFA